MNPDQWIAHVKDCKHLPENELKLLCEKVKELLVYDELTLSEIAVHLNYSSVAHLSNQFKKRIGLTPSAFKNLKDKKRRQIEDI